ncbi:MAG: hypothetical protein AAF235_04255 [Planctomycetota bacterium]
MRVKCLISAVVLATLSTLASAQPPGWEDAFRLGSPLPLRLAGDAGTATTLIDPIYIAPQTYHIAAAPAVGNGRAWTSGFITGRSVPSLTWPGSGNPAARYGVIDRHRTLAVARRGGIAIAFSPWERYLREGQEDLTVARNAWLRRRGLVGGVRTFTKPTAEAHRDAAARASRLGPDARMSTPPHWGW